MDKNNQLQQFKDQLDELKEKFEDELKKSQIENEKLKDEIKLIRERRVSQVQILPDAIKSRHISEGVRFIRSGIAANKPIIGETTLQGAAVYFDETNKKLYIYNVTNGAWEYSSFT